ncbi:MAG: twin-arginine translocation signal domain-containing protein [Vicinamibacterales bacterium]
MTRRAVLGGLAAAGGVGIAGTYLTSSSDEYDRLLEDQIRPLADDPDTAELVRYATLAASSHNTQPWRFRAGAQGIDILPDLTRRTPAVDPDDHHLYASIGCAAENLSIAAKARGRSGDVQFLDHGDAGRVRVALGAAPHQETALFRAIPQRQCARAVYDSAAVGHDVLARLDAASRIGGVEPVFVMDVRRRDQILDLIIAGNSVQLDDPAFVHELKSWLRFNERAAAASRDGLFGAASGNPRLPNWIGPMMFDLFITKDGENARVAEQVRSSSGLVAFIAPSNDRAGWTAAGRAYQRFALQATVDGLKHAFVNQAVEVPDARRELRSLLGTGERRPSLLVRFGFGPAMPRSLRRSVRDVLLTS